MAHSLLHWCFSAAGFLSFKSKLMGCGNTKGAAQPAATALPPASQDTSGASASQEASASLPNDKLGTPGPSLDHIFKQMKSAVEIKDRQWMGATYKT